MSSKVSYMENKKTPGILKIGISGKRSIPVDQHEIVKRKIQQEINDLLLLHQTNEFIAYSALATGADTLFADVAVNIYKKPLRLIFPFPVSEYEKDFTDKQALDTFKKVISNQHEIYVLSPVIPANRAEREDAYFEQGKYFIKVCDTIIFIWDGLRPAGKGGTAEIMSYHSEIENTCIAKSILLSPDNEDILYSKINAKYEVSNAEAITYRDKHRVVWKSVIMLGWLAVLMFSVKISWQLKGLAGWLLVTGEFFMAFTVIMIVFAVAKPKRYHEHYLTHRIRAETLRLLKCFYHAGVKVIVSGSTIKNDLILSEIAIEINDTIKSPDFYHSKWYANYIIKQLIQEQINYHQGRISAIGVKPVNYNNINIFIGFLFLLNICLLFLNTTLLHFYSFQLIQGFYNCAVFFTIMLPATYAAIEGVLYYNEWNMLKIYSESVLKSFDEVKDVLPAAPELEPDTNCSAEQSQALNLISSIMLTDNKNWHLVFEDKHHYHLII